MPSLVCVHGMCDLLKEYFGNFFHLKLFKVFDFLFLCVGMLMNIKYDIEIKVTNICKRKIC